jgi:2-methylcitrate dehydratase PrpD
VFLKIRMTDAVGTNELTRHICHFAATTQYRDIPSNVIAKGKGHILDALGCALAGSVSPGSEILRSYLANGGGAPGGISVFGSDLQLTPRFAAFANGAAIHADNFDDTAPQPSADRNGGIHATGSVLAATLAIAEQQGRSGVELMEALHIGVEISCKLNHSAGAEHHARGYHSTSTINIFGISAAVGHLIGLDEDGLSRAFGIAASQSAGLRENFGTMANPFHSGHAAECAVVSANLAARGFTAAKNIFESPLGFFYAYAGGYEPSAIMGRLGAPWAFVDPGTWIKPYPCGSLTHPAITMLIAFSVTHDIKPEQVQRVRVQTNRRVANTLIHNRPTTALLAKFSMPFSVAIALLYRKATLGEFVDEVVRDPAVQMMMEKVDYTAYESLKPDYTNVTTLVELSLTDGRHFSLRADFGKGTPRDPMSFDDLADKFRGCADYARWPREKAEAIIEQVAQLETVNDVRRITRLLSSSVR